MDARGEGGTPQHYPVLLNESLEYLGIRPDGLYLDLTAGLGGHTKAIAERLHSGLVIACDRDAESLELARQATAGVASRVRFFHGSFSEMLKALEQFGVAAVD